MGQHKRKLQIVFGVLFAFIVIFLGFKAIKYFYNYDNPMNENERIALEKKEQYRKDLTGKGHASNIVDLREGKAIIEVEHIGAGDFQFDLSTNDHQLIMTIAKGTGDMQKKVVYDSPKEDAYMINVITDGDWKVKIR